MTLRACWEPFPSGAPGSWTFSTPRVDLLSRQWEWSMTTYVRRPAWMGALCINALGTLGPVVHAYARCYLLLALVGEMQAKWQEFGHGLNRSRGRRSGRSCAGSEEW